MRNLVPLLAGLLLAFQSGIAQQEGPTTNIRAYQILAGRIGDSLNASIGTGDSVRVLLSVRPDGSAWLVDGGIAQALQEGRRTVVVMPPADYAADLGILEMHVVYRNARSEGMFSGKIVDREVALNMSAQLVDQRSGIMTLNTEFREALIDTVRVAEIPTLEDPNIPFTQGTPPGEGFFSSFAEPLIMIGAVAVAVYLLFAVRS
jgi:hypothetical protein